MLKRSFGINQPGFKHCYLSVQCTMAVARVVNLPIVIVQVPGQSATSGGANLNNQVGRYRVLTRYRVELDVG